MKILRPLGFVYRLYFALIFFGSLFVLYPAFYYLLDKEERHPKAFKLKRAWAYFLTIACLAPIVVKRDESFQLPPPPYIICANHTSFLDIIYMYVMFPDLFLFMGKSELLKWPLFGIFFRKMDIAVNRKNPRAAVDSLRLVTAEIQKGKSFALFPEGTIPATVPVMKGFKNGAFSVAIENQVPIVPVTFLNNHLIMSEHLTGSAHPGIARAIVHNPIATEGMTMEDLIPLRTQIFQIIKSGQHEH
jgi:1-acyl-sn-glycerol-3-phosphate acyltransferase